MCLPESCSHQFNIQLQVGQPDHSHVWIHIHVSAGVLLSSIDYSAMSRPVCPTFTHMFMFPVEPYTHELSTGSQLGHSDHYMFQHNSALSAGVLYSWVVHFTALVHGANFTTISFTYLLSIRSYVDHTDLCQPKSCFHLLSIQLLGNMSFRIIDLISIWIFDAVRTLVQPFCSCIRLINSIGLPDTWTVIFYDPYPPLWLSG